MKKMKSLFAAAVTSLVAISVLAGCGQAPEQSAASGGTSESAAGTSKPKLIMATSADYKPFEFHDTSSGEDKIVGFDIDIANYIAKELGYDLQISDMDFNGIIPSLQSGRADFAMASITPKPERLKNADFSQIYYEQKNSIVTKSDANLIKPQDLAGKKVGVQLGSIQEGDVKEMQKTVKGMDIVTMNKISELVQELKSGRMDAAVIEDNVAKGFVKANPDLKFTTIQSEGSNGAAVAFPKGSDKVKKVDEVIKKMKENGELDKLIKKWFGQ